jgi:hypothetical protein
MDLAVFVFRSEGGSKFLHVGNFYVFETMGKTEEHRLKVSENRVLRIFEPKMDRVIGGWRK